MTKLTRRFFLGSAATSVAALSAPNVWAQGAAGGVVNLYTARHYDTDEAIYTNFTRATGIRVNRIEAEADSLMQRMRAEGANSPADIFVAVDAGRLWRAHEAGLLQPVRSAALEAAVPANFREPEGHWYGLSKRARVIVYDKARVRSSDIPTYESLADAKWRGKILVRSSTHVYNLSLVGALIAAHGEARTEEWARGIVANLARPPRGGDLDQIRGVAAGEGEIAIVNSYYHANALVSQREADRAAANKTALHFPNQGPGERGTHVNIAGAGIARHSPNRANAVRFLEYLAAPEAQAIFAEGNNEYPVVRGTRLSPTLAQLGEFREDALSAATFGRNNEAALRLMDRAGWR
ncbi:MAG: Fe(3+) ABC transporter substrate-binding protein [Tagaea sp.]